MVIAILAVVLVLPACKKERANIDTRPAVAPPSPQKQIRLSKIKHTNNAQYWEHSFIYNSLGYLVAHNIVWESNGQYTSATQRIYEYDGNTRLIKEIIHRDNEPECINKYTYSGDTLKRMDYIEGGELQSYTLYESYNGKITRKTNWRVDGSLGSDNSFVYDMYGNLAEIESYAHQGYYKYRVDNIQYDDKPNCYRTIKGPVDMSYMNPFDPQVWSSSNVTSFESEQDSFGERTFVNLLSYHKHGYLSKLTRYGGREVFEYEYEEY